MEFWIDFLYAFGIGIAFILGATATAIVLGSRVKKQTADFNEMQIAHNDRVEQRLDKYVENTAAMVDGLHRIADEIKN